jgi:single-strand DNA-binding protein
MSYGTQISIAGNIVQDPELRFTTSGKAVCSLSVAVSQGKDAESAFYDVTAWDTLGENVASCLTKGDRVVVVGTPRQRTYDAKDGTKRRVHEIQADDIGASVTWATVVIDKVDREGGGKPRAVKVPADLSDLFDGATDASDGTEPF